MATDTDNCNELAIHKSLVTGSPAFSLNESNSQLEHKSIPVTADSRATTSTSDISQEGTTADSDSCQNSYSVKEEKVHTPIIMGSSHSKDSLGENEKAKKSKMARIRHALRKTLNGSKDGKNKQHTINLDQTNNNNGVVKPDDRHYIDDNIKSSTLPAYTNGRPLLTEELNSRNTATLQARLLPAYKDSGIIGNISNRQRIMSSPTYSMRPRTSSQSSAYSRRYNSSTRVTSTYIPEHLDKRLVRSRSVGVISDAELKMRVTAAASVVKLDDVEDWVV